MAARVLYGDGAWYVLVHLLTRYRFNDYDFQRSFASYISQSPILFGQRLGLEPVAVYAALYSLGIFVFPALAMLAALFLSRRQPALFAANAVAIVVYGFGLNFINSEANLLFGLVWLAATIMALDRPAPILRGIVLPLISIALLRTYEGMLLVGPILAAWALVGAGRADSERERIGLALSALLLLLGAIIGFGGFLAPRDPGNAAGFLGSAFRYLGNPQGFLLLCALLVLPAIYLPRRPWRLACAVLSVICGVAFLAGMARLEGYYAFDVYYVNRSFLVLSLPVFVGLLFAAYYARPQWLARGSQEAYAWVLIPVAFAVAGDMFGTFRWGTYVKEFCAVLDRDAAPAERLGVLMKSGVRTAWPWTHPTMSVLLRDRGSRSLVTNEPNQRFEPFDPALSPSIEYWGLCQAPLLGKSRSDPFVAPVSLADGKHPPFVSRITGLSHPEGWAVWSNGPAVDIEFAQALPRSFDLTVRLGSAFGANRQLPIRVRAGTKEQSFVVERDPYEVTLKFRDIGEARKVSFVIPKPESPLELGSGSDKRKLGIAFVWLALTPREDGPSQKR